MRNRRSWQGLWVVALSVSCLFASPPAQSAESSGQGLYLGGGSATDIAVPGKPLPEAPRPLDFGAVTGYVVRVAYIVPTNRSAQAGAVTNLRNAVLLYQGWYKDQMERNGFGPKTFRLEMESDGKTPKVYTVGVTNMDADLRTDIWGRTLDAAANAGVPVWTPKQVWFLISEAHLEMPDGSVTGGTALGASFGSGDDPGVGMLGGDAVARFKPGFFTNDSAYHNQVLPEIGPYPLKQDISFPWFEGTTFSSISSSILGAGIHETSHGFGLPHDFRNDQNFNGNLMGNGLRGIRGALMPKRYPLDYTRASYGSALALNVSRYFNTNLTYADNTAPSLNITTTGTNTPVNGLLQISFTASDAGGLSAAMLQLNGDAVGEMVLSGTSVSRTFATAYYNPGQTDQFSVTVWDASGNKQSANTSIVARTGFNRAPQPFMTLSPPTVFAGQNVLLGAGNSSDPDEATSSLKVEWDLNNDGIFDTAQTTTKTLVTNFLAAGDRLIRCRVTDSFGAQTVSAPLALRVAFPSLSIVRTGSVVSVSWETNADTYVLQRSLILPATNWLAVTQTLSTANGYKILTVSNPPGNQFYRLKR